MEPKRLPDKLTKLTPHEAIAALATAYDVVLQHSVDASTLAILVAKTALETGVWQKIHWNNFGNWKGFDSATGLYTMFPCDEVLPAARAAQELHNPVPREPQYGPGECAKKTGTYADGTVRVYFWPPHSQCMFRAYENPARAAEKYIAGLALDTNPSDGKPNRYAAAWRAADERDDPDLFARELKRAGYFTAPVEQYVRGVVGLYKQFWPLCSQYLAQRQDAIVTQPDPDGLALPSPAIDKLALDRDRVLGLIALTLDQEHRDRFESPEPGTEPSV